MIAQTLILLVAANIPALRATAGAAGTVVATTRAGIVQLYRWNAGSTAPDDGVYFVAPGPGAGRWELAGTLDATESYGSVVMAVAWPGDRAGLRLAKPWRIVGADATRIYIAADID